MHGRCREPALSRKEISQEMMMYFVSSGERAAKCAKCAHPTGTAGCSTKNSVYSIPPLRGR